MKKMLLTVAISLSLCFPMAALASQGVAIQRVITNTRSELGQLASSDKAREIAGLMKTFDAQYETWSSTCGKETFNPEQVSDACKEMAEQMRETGIKLYGRLSSYLPDVAVRYEQGAREAKGILDSQALNQTPAELYQATMDGITEVPQMAELSPGEADSPFDIELESFPDPTEKMFAVLEKLVPDFGREIPEAVRAGNTHVTMMKKAKMATLLADQFSKARFALESQREYGEIIFSATQAVHAMPEVLGIQYTGTRLDARPNEKVLNYYNRVESENVAETSKRKSGGFAPRS